MLPNKKVNSQDKNFGQVQFVKLGHSHKAILIYAAFMLELLIESLNNRFLRERGMAHTRLTSTKRFTNLNLSRRQKNQAILCSDY